LLALGQQALPPFERDPQQQLALLLAPRLHPECPCRPPQVPLSALPLPPSPLVRLPQSQSSVLLPPGLPRARRSALLPPVSPLVRLPRGLVVLLARR
jgi:hypothetical protein